MIASLVTPILWLGALERFSRWQTNRNPPAGGALLTAVALAVMVTLDTPVSIGGLVRLGMTELEVVTVQRLLLLVACFGALVFAFGHPLASSGVRLMIQLARQFEEHPEARYGLTAMCVGLGQGGSVIWENPHFDGKKGKR